MHVRGEHIFRDEKYPLDKHPNYRLTADYDESLFFNTDEIIRKNRQRVYDEQEDSINILGNTELIGKQNE